MTASEEQIVVCQPNETVRLDVRLENETVWLTQLKIAEGGCKTNLFARRNKGEKEATRKRIEILF